MTKTNTNPDIPNKPLPLHGYSRASELLPYLPFGSTSLWKHSKEGTFPKPIKFSEACTAWDNAEIHKWLEEKKQSSNDANN